MKLTAKKILLQIFGFLISIAPIIVVVGLKWDTYTATKASSVSLGVGGAMAVILILCKALGVLPKKIKPIIGYAVAFVLVCLLDGIIRDLKLLLGMALLGEVLDVAIFRWQITRIKKQIDANITAEATAKAQQAQTNAIIEAIKSTNGRV